MTVSLQAVDRNIRIGQTTTDVTGQASFPDVPPGRYLVHASRDGFTDLDSPIFEVDPGETEQVLFEMKLTLVRETVDVVVPANSPTESIQPVAVSDVLNGTKMDVQRRGSTCSIRNTTPTASASRSKFAGWTGCSPSAPRTPRR